jgi:L-amino acid N-acyltransferase YncA
MIRAAIPGDIDRVVEIYNQAIDARFQTAFTERLQVADRVAWLDEHIGTAFPMFVYTIDDKVVGWVSISPYRQGRAALRYAVEISYFIDDAYQRQGIGSKLLAHAIDACRKLKYKTVIAIILEKNIASAVLLEKNGFRPWALLPNVADFEGEECSQVYYGIKL